MSYGLFHAIFLMWDELALFSATGFLLLGLDELAVDLIWLGRALWRRLFVYNRNARISAETLRAPERSGLIAVFVAAWDESEVIGAMLRNALASFVHDHYRIYVGCYPNDAATIDAVRAVDDARLVLVIGHKAGPTTKADCLNTLWHRLLTDEAHGVMCVWKLPVSAT